MQKRRWESTIDIAFIVIIVLAIAAIAIHWRASEAVPVPSAQSVILQCTNVTYTPRCIALACKTPDANASLQCINNVSVTCKHLNNSVCLRATLLASRMIGRV